MAITPNRTLALLLAVLPLTLSGLSTATAVTDEPYPTAVVLGIRGTVIGDTATFTYRASRLTPDVTVVQTFYGCGGEVIARKRVTGKSGTYRYNIEIKLRKAKRKIKVLAIIRQPDHQSIQQHTSWGPIPGAHC